jgi:hypothetical protein
MSIRKMAAGLGFGEMCASEVTVGDGVDESATLPDHAAVVSMAKGIPRAACI